MRSFIITLILLIAMILSIIANAIYINNTTAKIIELANDKEFKNAPEDAFLRLESFWESNKIAMEFSVGIKSSDRISELILDLKEYIATGNPAEARRVRALIADCASDISRLEKLSVESLL